MIEFLYCFFFFFLSSPFARSCWKQIWPLFLWIYTHSSLLYLKYCPIFLLHRNTDGQQASKLTLNHKPPQCSSLIGDANKTLHLLKDPFPQHFCKHKWIRQYEEPLYNANGKQMPSRTTFMCINICVCIYSICVCVCVYIVQLNMYVC